jgi:hypothetical protein
MQRDVSEGRAVLNFSAWERPQEEAKVAAEEVLEGEMPLRICRLMHAHARLSAADREPLARGLERGCSAGCRDGCTGRTRGLVAVAGREADIVHEAVTASCHTLITLS